MYIPSTLSERAKADTLRSIAAAWFLFSCTCICSVEKLPVEAKLPWYKQAQELEEGAVVSEEPS